MGDRKNARQFDQFNEFFDAISELTAKGQYTALVWHHANMMHAMHTMRDQNPAG